MTIPAADNNVDISDFITSKLQDPLSRVTGVGDTQVFGAPVRHAHLARSLQAAQLRAEAVGRHRRRHRPRTPRSPPARSAPSPPCRARQLNATVTAQSRLQTPEQFRNIILKTATDGAVVQLGDVARVELGADTYGFIGLLQRPSGRGHGHQAGARRQRPEHRRGGQGQGRTSCRPPCRRA